MPKVLIIEDELNIRIFVSANLEMRGYTVLQAERGGDGLALMKSDAPDLVILDMLMPDMNGMAVLRAMSGDDDLRLIPVILMTASVNVADLEQFPNLVHRLVKPVSVTTLLETVQAAFPR